MNIFANIILTSDNEIKELLIQRLWLEFLDEVNGLEILENNSKEFKTVFIDIQNEKIDKAFEYIKDNYEPIKIINIENSIQIDVLDLKDGDIMMPHTFINTDWEGIFITQTIDKNYDLNKFWLIMNGICLSKNDNIKDNEELLEIKEKISPDIMDKNGFEIADKSKKLELIDKTQIIRIIWDDIEYKTNGVDILELSIT